MSVAWGMIRGTKFEIEDGFRGPILTIESSREGVINTTKVLLEKKDLQYMESSKTKNEKLFY